MKIFTFTYVLFICKNLILLMKNCSIVDPKSLNLDPDPGLCYKFWRRKKYVKIVIIKIKKYLNKNNGAGRNF